MRCSDLTCSCSALLAFVERARTPLSRPLDLGVFGKQMVDGEGGVGGDLALVGTFFVVVLVGTFASQVRADGLVPLARFCEEW